MADDSARRGICWLARQPYSAHMERARSIWRAISPWFVPAAILVLGAIDLAQNGSLSSQGATATFPGPLPVHAAFLCGVTVPLYWRFRAPVIVLLTVTAASTAWILTMFNWADQPPFEPFLAMIVALYAMASLTSGRRLIWGTAIPTAVFAAGEITGGLAGQGIGNVFPALLFWCLAWILGRAAHAYRLMARNQQARADKLEDEQDLRIAAAASDERARIARELHDVIAHGLSVIVVQAGAERRVLGPEQEPTAQVLRSIEDTGRQAMTELRRLLGLLRRAEDQPALRPQPGLSALPALVQEVTDAGLEVELCTEGDLAEIPKGVDMSAYRIVQESLTNVLKHANASSVTLTLRCRNRRVEIDVTDDGSGTADHGPLTGTGWPACGSGQRSTAAGSRPGSLGDHQGFQVHAMLPFDQGVLVRS